MYDRIFYVNRTALVSMLLMLSARFTCSISYVRLKAKVAQWL